MLTDVRSVSHFPAFFPSCAAAALAVHPPAHTCSFFYVELHQPYANDNTPDYKGIAIRLMGESCG